MATMMNRLTAVKVQALKTSGLYPDGGGLYLKVKPSGSTSWVFRYMLRGRPRYLGLGPTTSVTLAQARMLAAEARDLIRQNIDPIDRREQERAAAKHADARALTFRQCAEALIASHEPDQPPLFRCLSR
jgi:hypothetical protein